jgi:hypothetical protein
MNGGGRLLCTLQGLIACALQCEGEGEGEGEGLGRGVEHLYSPSILSFSIFFLVER